MRQRSRLDTRQTPQILDTNKVVVATAVGLDVAAAVAAA
jgi:hypothetical protein